MKREVDHRPVIMFKKLHPDAKRPEKKTLGAAAFDVYSVEEVTLLPSEVVMVRTGLSVEIPTGWKLEVYPRSGLSIHGIEVVNSPGKIDSDYRGELKVLLRYTPTPNQKVVNKQWIPSNPPWILEPGSRIAQLELNPVFDARWEEVNELSETDRGTGGFGSTGIS